MDTEKLAKVIHEKYFKLEKWFLKVKSKTKANIDLTFIGPE